MSVRHECREPMSIIFKIDFSDTAGPSHLLKLFDAIEEENPYLLLNNEKLKDYIIKIRKGILK